MTNQEAKEIAEYIVIKCQTESEAIKDGRLAHWIETAIIRTADDTCEMCARLIDDHAIQLNLNMVLADAIRSKKSKREPLPDDIAAAIEDTRESCANVAKSRADALQAKAEREKTADKKKTLYAIRAEAVLIEEEIRALLIT